MHLTAASAWKGKHHRIIGNKHFLGHKKGIISPSVFAENKSIAKSLYAFLWMYKYLSERETSHYTHIDPLIYLMLLHILHITLLFHYNSFITFCFVT